MISKYIEHTNLKPTATVGDIFRLCSEAAEHKFRGVCVNPRHVATAISSLKRIDNGEGVRIITVVGFPLGANTTETKIAEAIQAIENGANEVDVVWDLASFKQKEYWRTLLQLTKIREAIYGEVMKVIVEECYLTGAEQEIAYQIVEDSGADYIKTSTGFGKSGARLTTVRFWNQLRLRGKDNLKIKAAGGIKDYETAELFIDFGADVLGTSHGIAIINQERLNDVR